MWLASLAGDVLKSVFFVFCSGTEVKSPRLIAEIRATGDILLVEMRFFE